MADKELQERNEMGIMDSVNISSINEDRFVTITNKYYLYESNDIFKGLDCYSIKILMVCLCIADMTITKNLSQNKSIGEGEMSGVYISYKDISKLMKQPDSKKSIIKCLKQLASKSIDNACLDVGFGVDIHFFETPNEEFYMYFKKDLLLIDTVNRKYVKLFLGDILETKSNLSMYIKLKINRYIDKLNFKSGINIDVRELASVGGITFYPKRYLERAYKYLMSENPTGKLIITLVYDKQSETINITGDVRSWHKNIELNCNKYKINNNDKNHIKIGYKK